MGSLHQHQQCDTLHEGQGMQFFITSRIPINKKKTDEIEVIDDETYDEIAVETVSKCLARMSGYWDPEFEPRSWTINDIILWRFSLLWQARTLGDFPIHSSTWHGMAGGSHIQVNWLKPCAPILCNTEHAQLVDVSKVHNGGVQQRSAVLYMRDMRDEGCSITSLLHPKSQSTKNNSANQ